MRSIFHHLTHLKWSWNFEVGRSGREKKMRVVCATTFLPRCTEVVVEF